MPTAIEESTEMAKRKAAPKDDGTQSAADAKAPDDSVYIGQSVKPESLPARRRSVGWPQRGSS